MGGWLCVARYPFDILWLRLRPVARQLLLLQLVPPASHARGTSETFTFCFCIFCPPILPPSHQWLKLHLHPAEDGSGGIHTFATHLTHLHFCFSRFAIGRPVPDGAARPMCVSLVLHTITHAHTQRSSWEGEARRGRGGGFVSFKSVLGRLLGFAFSFPRLSKTGRCCLPACVACCSLCAGGLSLSLSLLSTAQQTVEATKNSDEKYNNKKHPRK